MYGRNGVDQLNRALAAAYLILFFGGTLLARLLKSDGLAMVFAMLENLVMLLLIFRMLSKNLYKRREENQKWMSWWWKLKNDQAGAKARHADKDHKYFTCKTCGASKLVPTASMVEAHDFLHCDALYLK